jgi:hypothetical protein
MFPATIIILKHLFVIGFQMHLKAKKYIDHQFVEKSCFVHLPLPVIFDKKLMLNKRVIKSKRIDLSCLLQQNSRKKHYEHEHKTLRWINFRTSI